MPNNYFFIDECGDPEFYGKRKRLLVGQQGYQPLLIIGMVETSDRRKLRQAVLEVQHKILNDSLYRTIPSLTKPDWFLHARADHPEVRAEFFKFIRNYPDIRFHAVIGRKDLEVFNRKHNNNPSEFYFDLVHHLLQGRLREGIQQNIYLSRKQKLTLSQLTAAIDKAIEVDNRNRGEQRLITYTGSIEKSSQMPEMSIVDYLLWALQRYLLQGEIRFWETIEPKVGSVCDLYDKYNPNGNQYDGQLYQLRLEKMSSFDWQIPYGK